MQIVERGQGTPLVFLSSMQGRWQYSVPTIEALARHFRVITFTFCDERSARFPFDGSRPIESYTAQVEAAMHKTGVTRAVICGVSYGGVVALRFAAAHPERVAALVLASTPGPDFHLRPRHDVYARLPWMFGPLFLAETPWRVGPEIRAAIPNRAARRQFKLWALATFARNGLSLTRMAARARLIATFDRARDCARISAPALVVTGEAGLDFVVPVSGTSDYARRIAGAQSVVIERTGHLGTLTRPDRFAEIVRDFVAGQRDAAA